MKKLLKQLLGGALALTMLLTLIPAPKAKAANVISISVNQTYSFAGEDKEGKLLSFVAPTNGYFSVSAIATNGSDHDWSGVYVTVLNESGAQILDRFDAEVRDGKCVGAIYATKANRQFYVKVDDKWGSDILAYTIRVDFVSSEEWENESNDTAGAACSLQANQWKYGTISYDDEADFYKFSVKKTSKVKVTFGPKEVSGNSNEWHVYIINSYGESYTLTNSAISTEKTETLYLKKGTYYLKVTNSWNAANVPYKLKYSASNFSVKAPTIKKVSIKKKSYSNYRYLNYITLKKNNDVSGFSVQVAKKNNMKGKLINRDTADVQPNSNISKTKINYTKSFYDDTLSTQKKYYTRVKAYVYDPFGAKIYGKWSKVKKA